MQQRPKRKRKRMRMRMRIKILERMCGDVVLRV